MARLIAICLGIWVAFMGPLWADETITARFDIRLGPLKVADLVVGAEVTDRAYALAARVTSAGLAGAFRDVRFDMNAEGRREAGALFPARYAEDIDTGRRLAVVELRYRNGLPDIAHILPDHAPTPWDISLPDQRGTVDPLSALLRVMYLDSRGPCNWQINVFDGRRRSELMLGPTRPDGSGVICTGHYRRIAGFSPEDMAERITFPITAHYAPDDRGELRLTRVDADTLYGRVRIIRRD